MFRKIKGTQDFLDLTLFNFIVDQGKKHLALYNFTEIATPIIEPLDMYKRSTGETTEVVTKQMFKIASHKGDEEICLRPEATPSVIRTFIENSVQNTPWKVFTWGPMFRYERPQKGRYRQFHQFNMEVVGSNSVSQDAQFLKMLDRFFHEKLNLSNYALLINYLGCFEDRKVFHKLLDGFLEDVKDSICAECKVRKEKNILRVFDCKNPSCQEIYKDAPYITDNLCKECSREWETLKEELSLLSVSFVVSKKLVRGLDYYSKTVFEFVSQNLGAQSAFCAGGRYNQLVSQLGGKVDQPSIGAAIGIGRLLLLLQDIKETLVLPQKPALHLILPVEQKQQALALLLADNLQNAELCADVLLEGGSIKSMMRKANKMGAKYALILGPDEQQEKSVTVKNMMTGDSQKVLQVDLVKHLK
ncbi:histidine--tRNA ligase [Candidatus Dependentiae bacterium]